MMAGEHGDSLHHPLGWLALGLMVVHIALNWRPLLCAGARVLGLRKASGATFHRSVVDIALVLLLPLVIITSEIHGNIWWHVGAGTLMVGVLVWHIVLNGRVFVRNVGRIFGAS